MPLNVQNTNKNFVLQKRNFKLHHPNILHIQWKYWTLNSSILWLLYHVTESVIKRNFPTKCRISETT